MLPWPTRVHNPKTKAAQRGRFNDIRQVAPLCTPKVPPVTHAPPTKSTTQPASQSVQLFCTAHGRVSSGMPGHVLSPKDCAFAWRDMDP